MDMYKYAQAFRAADTTSEAMQQAISRWFGLYYGRSEAGDPNQRLACTVVGKLTGAVFGEYGATAGCPVTSRVLEALDKVRRQAFALTMVGGECYLKPCPGKEGFTFSLIPRDRLLVFGRDPDGMPTDVGTLQQLRRADGCYTLLERRQVTENGQLLLENTLYRSDTPQTLGKQVSLSAVPQWAALSPSYLFPALPGGIGLVRMKTPLLNCVDGSAEGVSIYAPAEGLMAAIDENEAQLAEEFRRGESRIIASRDMLRDGLQDHLFVGLDEDPDRVGITIFSPKLRYEAFLARKQEYLRNVESALNLRRGMLSDANVEDRTATEITSSAGDFNLTVISLQQMWQQAVADTLTLCAALAALYRLPEPDPSQLRMDWGNGVLYDEARTWQEYLQMVKEGLLKPEIALGWRFGMPAVTEAEQAAIRQAYMPKGGE